MQLSRLLAACAIATLALLAVAQTPAPKAKRRGNA